MSIIWKSPDRKARKLVFERSEYNQSLFKRAASSQFERGNRSPTAVTCILWRKLSQIRNAFVTTITNHKLLNMFQVNKALRIDEQFQIYNIDKQFVTWKQGIFDLRFAWKAEVKTKNQIHCEVWRPRMWNPIQGLRSSEQINAGKMFQLRKHFTRRGLRHGKFLLKISLLFLMCQIICDPTKVMGEMESVIWDGRAD